MPVFNSCLAGGAVFKGLEERGALAGRSSSPALNDAQDVTKQALIY